MKTLLSILVLAFCVGCAGARSITPAAGAPSMARQIAQQSSAAQPAIVTPPTTITWAWNPGAFTNFVVVANPDLSTPITKWNAVLFGPWPGTNIIQATNFTVSISAPQMFYSLYGTNGDGDFAWCVK